ncbi:MAG: TagF domain-containing protein [Deltaproteobacteria bacterium]|nr:TagF domain-containing protein [Deltaproteobacteria bacterium]
MLGSIKSSQPWQWSASGKHPAMKDFFNLGHNGPLALGFSEWVKNGFQQVGSPKDPSSFYSWRFWARGFKKENLACGIVRDSSDSLGRPYPILIMGLGPLNGWEEVWDLLPSACEITWNQMEYLSTRIFKGLKQLEEEVQNIQLPSSGWEELAGKRGDFEELERQVLHRKEEKEFFIHLDQEPLDPSAWIRFWHFHFKKKGEGIPNALFMGGTLAKAFLAVFKRPLVASDFVRLWSVASAELQTAISK